MRAAHKYLNQYNKLHAVENLKKNPLKAVKGGKTDKPKLVVEVEAKKDKKYFIQPATAKAMTDRANRFGKQKWRPWLEETVVQYI